MTVTPALRHPRPSLAVRPDAQARKAVARVTDAAGWTSKKPITFDAAI